MAKRVAVLSNVNVNSIIRTLKEEFEVYEPEGYGNELLLLLNKNSGYYRFAPEVTFLWLDGMELLHHRTEKQEAEEAVGEWFDTLAQALPNEGLFFISDIYLWGAETPLLENGERYFIEGLFRNRLEAFCREHANAYVLPYGRLIAQLGEEQAYSSTMWYLGKIPFSQAMQKAMCGMMREKIELSARSSKKVLVLDLDNTLWGGLAGEADTEPLQLSEEHTGLAYKNLQRVLKRMEEKGVMLAVVSKNNEADAFEIIDNHPHMVLRRESFVALKINWDRKADNLRMLAEELNVGLDSFVFFDDSPTEREQIKELLPEVTVPDFPEKPGQLSETMVTIYRRYFEKLAVTEEDKNKTAQYAANAKRSQLKQETADISSFLKQLQVRVEVMDAAANLERFHQLVNKTNQFNLTTIRYTREELIGYLGRTDKLIKLYRVTDKFGDNGIAGALIVDLSKEVPAIEEFVLSCRIMGRLIEHAIVDKLEQELMVRGFEKLQSRYVKTAKNEPVRMLFEELGYSVLEDSEAEKRYEILLADRPGRVYYIEEWRQEDEG